MRKIYLVLSILALTIACEKEEDIIIPKATEAVEVIAYKDLPDHIKTIIPEDFSNGNKSALGGMGFGKPRTDVPANKNINKNGRASYTLLLDNSRVTKSPTSFYFDNLVVKELEDGGEKIRVIRYEPEESWYSNPKKSFENYSGTVVFFDIEGNRLGKIEIMHGKAMGKSVNKASDEVEECIYTFAHSLCIIGVDGRQYCTYYYEEECTLTSGSGGAVGGIDTGSDPSGGTGTWGGGDDNTGGGSPGGDNGDDEIETTPLLPFEPLEPEEELKIEDSGLDDCLETILDTIRIQTHLHGIGKVIETFGGNDEKFNWTVQSGSLSGPTATTSTNYDTISNSTTTTFDSQGFPQGTDLSWVRTILHESAHAFVVSTANLTTLSAEQRKRYLGEDWLTVYIDDGHPFIASTYLTSIADILQEYGNWKGYTMDRKFYDDLAWGGLTDRKKLDSDGNEMYDADGRLIYEETPWFLAAYPDANDREKIKNVISVELTGKETNGETNTQKGTDAGC